MVDSAVGLESPSQTILRTLKDLSWEIRDLDGEHVSVLTTPLKPLTFHRNFVCPNKPALIKGVQISLLPVHSVAVKVFKLAPIHHITTSDDLLPACQSDARGAGAVDDWAALTCWTNEYLSRAVGGQQVTVASTPNGRADAVCARVQGGAVFALPYEEKMQLADVLQHFQQEAAGQVKDSVRYVQAQNDSLRQEFPQLLKDTNDGFPWATAAFGCEPEAINLWIGNHRSVTSLHRDHYQNIYVVVSGTKRFTLLPPSDRYRLSMADFPVARWQPCEGGWDLIPEDPQKVVSWCPVEIPRRASGENASGKMTDECSALLDASLPAPIEVEVHAGQALYIPAMYYHQVEQDDDESGRVIAVNFWYDMQYDCKFAYASLIDKLSQLCKP